MGIYRFLIFIVTGVCIYFGSLKWLEKKIGFKQGKGGMWKTCITIKNDIPEEEMDKAMKTNEGDHPKLVVSMVNDRLDLIELVGDKITCHMTEVNVCYAVIVLICSYYTFDLAYPWKFCQTFGFIQHKVMKEKYVDTKSQGFVNMLWQLSSKRDGIEGEGGRYS